MARIITKGKVVLFGRAFSLMLLAFLVFTTTTLFITPSVVHADCPPFPDEPPEEKTEDEDEEELLADPISRISGKWLANYIDLQISSGQKVKFALKRVHNGAANFDGSIGKDWLLSYDSTYIFEETDSGDPDYKDAYRKTSGGASVHYVYDDLTGGTRTFVNPSHVFNTIKKVSSTKYELTERDGLVRTYETRTGSPSYIYQLTDITDRFGSSMTFDYGDIGNRARLIKVTDPLSREINFQYNTNYGLLTRIYEENTDLKGRAINYYYDLNNQLLTRAVCATRDGRKNIIKDITYDASDRVSKVTNAEGQDYIIMLYDGNGRCTHQQYGTASQTWEVAYLCDGNGDVTKTTLTGRKGEVTEYYIDPSIRRTTKETRTVTINGSSTSVTDEYYYDNGRLLTKHKFPQANEQRFDYDGNGNLLTKIYDEDSSAGGEITEIYQYDTSSYDVLTKYTDKSSNVTTYDYDGSGNLLTKTHPDSTTEKYLYNTVGQVTRYTDPGGVIVDSEYQLINSASAYLTKRTRDVGGLALATSYEYDKAGNVTKVTDPEGNVAGYEYANSNVLTKITLPAVDGDNYVTELYYDENFRLTRKNQESESLGSDNWITMNYFWDTVGYRTRVQEEKGGAQETYVTTDYVYDLSQRLTKAKKYTDSGLSASKDTIYYYDQRGLVTRRETGSDTGTIHIAKFDTNGRVTKLEDGESNYQEFAYDGFNQLTRKTLAASSENHYEVYTYDNSGRVITKEKYTASNVRLEATTLLYDQIGQVTKVQNHLLSDGTGSTIDTSRNTTFEYDPAGNLTRLADNGSNNTDFAYDKVGRLTLITDPVSNKKETYYDKNGNVTKAVRIDEDGGTDPSFEWQYTYDPLNRLTRGVNCGYSASAANKITVDYAYNKRSNLTRFTDGLSRYADYAYDGLGRRTKVNEDSDTIAKATEFYYEDTGLLLTLRAINTGPANQDTAYLYDPAMRVTRVIYPDGDASTDNIDMLYDLAGRITSKDDQRGTTVNYEYNKRGLLTHVYTGSGATYIGEKYAYDGANRITSAERLTGATPTSESLVSNYYNSFNNLTRQAQKIGSAGARNIDYLYDIEGPMTKVTYPDGSTYLEHTLTTANLVDLVKRGGTTVANYDYVGSRVKKRSLTTLDDTPVTLELNPTYDEFARATKYQNYDATNTETLAEFDYTFNKLHNILSREYKHRTDTPDDNFTYDTLNRLTHVDYLDDGGNEKEIFVYDKLGNKTSHTARGSGSATSRLYNIVNELTKVVTTEQLYDPAGNLTKCDDSYTYHYDHLNRLTKIKENNDADDVVEFKYDALSRRIVKDVAGSNAVRYYYNGQRVLSEYDWNDPNETLLRYFVYGPTYIDEVVLMHDNGESEDYYYAHDMQYSPVGLISKDGTMVEYYEYDAYGKCTFLTGDGNFTALGTQASSKDNPYLFTGRRLDILDGGSLKLMYYRARYYDTDTGRFINRDPIEYLAGTANLYEYAGSNPVNFTDPLGFVAVDASGNPLGGPSGAGGAGGGGAGGAGGKEEAGHPPHWFPPPDPLPMPPLLPPDPFEPPIWPTPDPHRPMPDFPWEDDPVRPGPWPEIPDPDRERTPTPPIRNPIRLPDIPVLPPPPWWFWPLVIIIIIIPGPQPI